MKTDSELKADLMELLDAIPAVNAADIDIYVEHGMVTLSGLVDTHQTMSQLERTARRVSGIRGLEIKVKPMQTGVRKHH
jgi:osmotically-inducible protein OsmY